MTAATLAGLAAIALAAFTTEGAIGFGGTVIAASLGAQLVSLDVLLPAFIPLNLAMSAWLLARGAPAVAWRLLLVEVAPPVAVGAAAGLALFHLPARDLLAAVFGAFVVALATAQLAGRRGADAAPPPRALGLGLLGLGGVAHGLFGTGGPMIVYVVRRRLADKRAFRATLAVLWLVLNVALLVNFTALGLYARGDAWRLMPVAAALLPPGLWLGERVHRALDAARFERVVWTLLLVAGLALAVRAGRAALG